MASSHLLSQAVDSITSFGNTKAASTEVTQFTRPTSSPTDALVPFTYTKARIPQMDFSRKPAQNPRTDPAIFRLGHTQALEGAAVPSVSVDQSQGSENAEPKEISASSLSAVTCTPNVPDASAIHSDAVETSLNRAAPTASVEYSAKPSFGVPAFENNVRPLIESAQLSSATAVHQTVHQPQTKSDKVLRKCQEPTKATLHPKTLNDGELLSILLSRHKAEQQNRAKLQASQYAKDQEISDLKGVSHTLYEQLQTVKGREHAQQSELSKFHTFKEQWEPRIQLLRESFQSLTDDHHKLGQDAKDMEEQRKSIQTDKTALEVMLEDVRQAFNQDRARTKKILLEARHEMEMLEQTVETQDRELRANSGLLDNERDRSHRLEEAMSSITTRNEEFTRMFTGHKDVVIEKLAQLLEKSETPVVVNSQPQNILKPILDDCFCILKELQKAEMVKPKDFLILNKAVRSYANSLAKSMHHCESTSRTTKEGQQQLSSDVKKQLINLSDNINVKHALGEQLMDLREAKATIRERLLATEASLVGARQHVTVLETKEQFHLRRISELETGYAKLQSKESELLQMSLQFQEAEARNKVHQEQLTNLRDEASGVSKLLEQKIEETTGLTTSLGEVKSQLEEAHTKTVTFASQKAEYESQAAEQCEKMRKQLNQAANIQLEGLESKYLNQLKQLRQENSAAEARAEQQQVLAESSDQKRVLAETKLEQVKLQLEKLQTGIPSGQSSGSRNTNREPGAATPKGNPSTQSRGSQSRGRQDPVIWHPVRSASRPTQPDPCSAKRAADAHGEGVAAKRPRKLVSQGLGPVIADSQSQSPNESSKALPRNMRRLSKVAGKKTTKDKFERRFSQELEID